MSDQTSDDADHLQKLFWATMDTAGKTSRASDMGKTKSLVEQALAEAEQTTHPARNKIIALGFLGQCFEAQGWKHEAADAFEQALSLLKDVSDLGDYTLALTLQHIAFYYLGGLSQFDAAVALQRTASNLLDQLLPAGSRDRTFSLYRLGELLYLNDQNDDAESALNQALDAMKASEDPDCALMVAIVELLGDNYKDKKEYNLAERHYEHALSMVKRFLPDREDLLDRIANRVKSLRASRNF
jgi:tetratricopeptide (TPR) repeat protein